MTDQSVGTGKLAVERDNLLVHLTYGPFPDADAAARFYAGILASLEHGRRLVVMTEWPHA